MTEFIRSFSDDPSHALISLLGRRILVARRPRPGTRYAMTRAREKHVEACSGAD